MFKSFFKSYEVMFSQKINMWIYYFKMIPFLGKYIPQDLYKSLPYKITISTIISIISLLFGFFKKFIYILLIVMLPSAFLSDYLNINFNSVEFHILFFLNFIGGPLTENIFTNDVKKDFLMINLLRFNAKDYYLGNIFLSSLKHFVYFIFPLMILNSTFFESFVIALELSFFRIISQSFRLFIETNKGVKFLTRWYFVVLFSGISLIYAYALPFAGICFNSKTILLNIFFIMFILILTTISLLHLFKCNKYKSLAKSLIKINDINAINVAESSSVVFEDVKLDEKSFNNTELKNDKYKNKYGMDYLNYKFLERHKKIIIKPVKMKLLIIAGAFAVCIPFIFLFSEFNYKTADFILSSNGILVFVLYCMSSGERFTKALFFNCDNSLLRYKFYKDKKTILSNFTSRLKICVLINFVPALALACCISLIFVLSHGSFIRIIPIFISILTLSVFFAVHYLFLYYIVQPYTSQLTIKSPIYKFASFAIYMLSYSCLKIKTSSIIFTLVIIIITILYTLIALYLVYKYAPKTFKLK